MDIEEFLDRFYQEFTKTTGAEKTFWKPTQEHLLFEQGEWALDAVDDKENKKGVGVFYKEVDADWVAGIHGAFPEFVRRFREALDEASRLDEERDKQEGRIAELELEVSATKQDLALQIDYTKDLEHELSEIRYRIESLEK
ncbi:hypothetical protein [Mycobacteroides chelonae]|uniref:hypothetical protein n=1 Tax=Mycobacteroides chelonae TaxID=1774 RepID=UPI0005C49AEA|nr:hypothetical protein [Mycobacteroides chelonae]OHT67815.1 hypothetical protein BKG66_24635 [Mycobacteroides chelonae]OHT69458.1 hypothetical protein BKG67_23170 [Mycobacteroides chelonae]